MKAILISIRPQWVEKILNGIKKDEIRKGTTIYKAINKLIAEQGVAPMLIYCTKDNKQGLVWDDDGKGIINNRLFPYAKNCPEHDRLVNGKVVARFNATAEKIEHSYSHFYFSEEESKKMLYEGLIERRGCISADNLHLYLKGKNGTAIHINDLEIFDEPKEISDFYKLGAWKVYEEQLDSSYMKRNEQEIMKSLGQVLTRAPQSWCYVEIWLWAIKFVQKIV